jgi:hypothetical protein
VATAEDGRPEVTGSGCYGMLVDRQIRDAD